MDYDRPTYLICEPNQLEEAARVLHKIGVEEIAGAFDAARSSIKRLGDRSLLDWYTGGTVAQYRSGRSEAD